MTLEFKVKSPDGMETKRVRELSDMFSLIGGGNKVLDGAIVNFQTSTSAEPANEKAYYALRTHLAMEAMKHPVY